MILIVSLAPQTIRLMVTSAAGTLLATRDASWRVGSGCSLASHVHDLLADQGRSVSDLSRIALIDRGGSYTSARTTYAFANSLAWAAQLPLVVVRPAVNESEQSAMSQAVQLQPTTVFVTPRYEDRRGVFYIV